MADTAPGDISDLLVKYGIGASNSPSSGPNQGTLEMSTQSPEPAPEAPTPPSQTPPPKGDISDLLAKYSVPSPKGPDVPPPAEQPPPKPEDDGFWSITGKSVLRGLITGGQEARAGLQVATGMPIGMAAEGLPQEHQDEVGALLKQGVSEGWSNPKWWGAQIGYGAASASPSIATGLAGAGLGSLGGPVGTAIGGAAGFGIGSAVQTIVPAFVRAKASGLDDDKALSQALTETGITAAFSAAMGMAPGMSVYGRTVENMLKRPIAEALTQMGVIQPVIGLAQQTAVAASQGRTITPDEALTGYVTMVGVGGTYSGLHMAGSHILSRAPVEAPPPGGDITPVPVRASLVGEPLDPMWRLKSRDIISEKGPNSANGGQWLATLRNAGVRDEELDALKIPLYLQDTNGKISKGDLLAHIEDNQIKLNDVVHEWDSAADAAYGGQTLPGPKGKYIEIRMQWDRGGEEPLPKDWQLMQYPNGEWGVHSDNLDGRLVGDTAHSQELAISNAWRASQEGRDVYKPQRYYGPHFEEPNVLAHIRATERIDRDGRRTLLAEELQSDWHQAGREEGYEPKVPIKHTIEYKPDRLGLPYEIKRDGQLRGAAMDEAGARRFANQLDREANNIGVPQAPFKTSWQELAFKRFLRYAADRGYERIAWTNGEQQIARYRGLDERQQRGMREFYGSPGDLSNQVPPQKGILDQIASKWGKRLGMESGQTRVFDSADAMQSRRPMQEISSALGPVRYLDVSPTAASRIRMGLPMWSRKPGEARITEADNARRGPSIDQMVRGFNAEDKMVRERRPMALEAAGAIKLLAKSMKVNVPLEIHIQPTLSHEGLPARGLMWADTKSYHIALSLEAHGSREEFFATAAHEFGHLIQVTHFEDASPLQKSAILASYEKWLRENPPSRAFNQMIVQRDNAVASFYDRANLLEESAPILSLTPERQRYWTSFEEWFAEQTARWATTSQKPLSLVEKFFGSLGRKIRDVIGRFREMAEPSGLSPDPHIVMKQWLDSHVREAGPWAADIVAKHQFETKRAAQAAFAADGTPEAPAEPQTPSTIPSRTIVASLFGRGDRPPRADADAAHADRINKFYETMLSMPQIAKLNPDNRALQYYKEVTATKDAQIKTDGSDSMTILGAIRRLHAKQEQAMWNMYEEYGLMKYLSQDEITNNVLRKPTAAEFNALRQKHGVDDRGWTVFQAITKRHDMWLDRYEQQMIREAERIRDPVQKADKMASVAAMMKDMRNTPFTPFMRFGNYGLVVKDSAGNVLWHESHDTPRAQRRGKEELDKLVQPGQTVEAKFIAKDAAPFRGMPAGMIDLMSEKLQLSDSQRFALDELRFEGGPAKSFQGRFRQAVDKTPGYSTDFRRAFANWEFHAAGYFANLQYIDPLRGFVKQMKDEAVALSRTDLKAAQKRDQVANFTADHLNYMMNPKGDFSKLRALAFHWYLGFSPAAATLNLSQTILMTYPFLAQHFGDARAIGAMLRASTKLSTFYRKASLVDASDRELRAMGELVREGTITEALAPQLAGTAENRNLSEGWGGNVWERATNTFNQWSSFFFEHTEQTNRRIAARAAFNLAMDHPDSPYVKRMVQANPLQYQRLLDRGFPPNEAAAITAAKDVVESTQFIYGQYARPYFMRGKAGSLFVFKSFTQNTLFNLWNYPGAAARTLLLMGALGGLLNMPGVEDINGIIRAIGFRIFGKDWDANDVARDFVTRLLGGKGETISHPGQIRTDQGSIRPDLLLHGLSRVGYGIPAVLDMLGNIAGKEHVPYPVSDRHQNIGMGNILPIEPGIMFAPEVTGMGASGAGNTSGQLMRETQRASGAIFGLGFAIYRAIMNSQLSPTDFRRYEQLMPQAFRNAAQAFRYYNEGAATTQRGAATVRFDPNEPEQMAEILAKAMGYQPLRLTAQWDRITAEREAIAYWDIRKQMLLRQAWAARNTNDPDTYARAVGAIKKYNQDLPEEARGKAITSDTLLKSFQTAATAKAKQEAGIPLANQNVPISRAIQSMYPEAQVGAGRRVR